MTEEKTVEEEQLEQLETLLAKLQLHSAKTMRHVIEDHLQPQAVKMSEDSFDLDDFIEEMMTAVHELNVVVEAAISVVRFRVISKRQVPMAVVDLKAFQKEIEGMSEEELQAAIGEKLATMVGSNDKDFDVPTGQYL